MKTNVTIGMCIVIALLTAGSASAWLDSYTYRQSITLTGTAAGAQTDYQLNLSIPFTSAMQADFDDVRFTQADGNTLIDAWLESKTDSTSAVVWAEFPTTPANGVDQIYYMYYGNVSVASDWNGSATFLQWHGSATSNFLDPFIIDPSSYVYEVKAKRTSTAGDSNSQWGLANVQDWNDDVVVIQSYLPGYANKVYCQVRDDATGSSVDEPPALAYDTWYMGKITYDGTTVHGYWNDNEIGSGITTNIPNEYMGLRMTAEAGTSAQDWSFVRKYAADHATYAFGSEEVSPVVAPPSIVAYNNITGARAHVPLDYGTTVLFNATAGDSITWSWTLDGVDQATSADNYIHTFSAGFGYYAVTVNATSALGTDTYTWGVWENMETTAETIPTFTDTSYQMLLDSIDYPPDMEEFGKAMAHPFVQMVGVIFYLFIFGIPLLMMYIRQDNMTMPTTLLLLFGSIIIFMLPPQWQIIAGALMTLGFVGILFKLYKERER